MLADRKTAEITFDPHVFTRQLERNFDIDFVEETIRRGIVHEEKSVLPEKLYITLYHGKERKTYHVIILIHLDFVEVKTVWQTLGR